MEKEGDSFKRRTEQEYLAAEEGDIEVKSLLTEIEPLLREYFLGDFIVREEGIELNFLNGQKFILTVKEIK